ncbi:MAG UNVERIFIED_CONTAM: hypothetical protein LVR18_15715 [Planctomycetaceae bacterium]
MATPTATHSPVPPSALWPVIFDSSAPTAQDSSASGIGMECPCHNRLPSRRPTSLKTACQHGHDSSTFSPPQQRLPGTKMQPALAGVIRGQAACWKLSEQTPHPVTLPLPESAEFLFNDITFSGTENVLAAAGLALDRETRTVQFAACVWRLTTDGPPVLAATLLDQESEPEAAGSNQECGGLTAIRLDPAQAVAITGAQDGRVRTWRLPDLKTGSSGEFIFAVDIEDRVGTGRSSRVITHSSRITSIDLSPSRRLLTADNEGQLIVWSRDVYGR